MTKKNTTTATKTTTKVVRKSIADVVRKENNMTTITTTVVTVNAKADFSTINREKMDSIIKVHNIRKERAEKRLVLKDWLSKKTAELETLMETKERLVSDKADQTTIEDQNTLIAKKENIIKAGKEQGRQVITPLSKELGKAAKGLVSEGFWKAYAERTAHPVNYQNAIKELLGSLGVKSGDKGYNWCAKYIEQHIGSRGLSNDIDLVTEDKALAEWGYNMTFRVMVVEALYSILKTKKMVEVSKTEKVMEGWDNTKTEKTED